MKDPHPYDPNCYGCRLKEKGNFLHASAVPSRQNSVPPRKADPAWERGIAGEHRVDGSFVPYLGADGEHIGVKAFGENRHQYEQEIKKLHTPETKVSAT